MKEKNGFIFIETIVTTVVLLGTLIYIYGTYNSMIREERKRLYFDDVSYVYKTQIIKEILEESISSNFASIVNNGSTQYYISVFNYGSDIFEEGSNGSSALQMARSLYNFGQIFYLDSAHISALKTCLREGDSSTDSKCINTLQRIRGYGDDTYLYNYLEKLDISSEKIANVKYNGETSASGIIIVLYYKSKNGSSQVNYGTYNDCLLDNYNSKFGASLKKVSSIPSEYKAYFTMQCENAYYISWAYFQKNK